MIQSAASGLWQRTMRAAAFDDATASEPLHWPASRSSRPMNSNCSIGYGLVSFKHAHSAVIRNFDEPRRYVWLRPATTIVVISKHSQRGQLALREMCRATRLTWS